MRNFSNPTAESKSLVIGLTGGIASGKSLAEQYFKALGAPVADADQVAREIVKPGSAALTAISREFGSEFLLSDGSLNRAQMRQLVFSDPEALVRLEKITHPRMREWLATWAQAQTAPYCIISAAILLESGLNVLVDRVLVVDVSVETQKTRLLERDSIPEELADKMISAQWSREKRLAAADDVIENNGDLKSLEAQINALHTEYMGSKIAI